jgi:hypothetical protein
MGLHVETTTLAPTRRYASEPGTHGAIGEACSLRLSLVSRYLQERL